MARPDKSEPASDWATRVLQARTLDGSEFHESADAALAELELLPPGQLRSRRAEELIRSLLSRSQPGRSAARHLDRLVQMGDEYSPDRPGWRLVRAASRLKWLLQAVTDRQPIDHRAAAREADRLAAEFPDQPAIQLGASLVQAMLALAYHPEDMSGLHAMLVTARRLIGDNPEFALTSETLLGLINAIQVLDLDRGAALKALAERLRQIEDLPEAGNGHGAAVVGLAPMLELIQALVAGVPDSELVVHDSRLAWLQQQADRPDIEAAKRAVYLTTRGGALLRQGAERDPARLSSAIDNLREAITLHPDRHPDHVLALVMLAWALGLRSQVTDCPADLDDAIAQLEAGRERARDASHPYWPFLNTMLTDLRLRRGDDTSQTRRMALEGLRGHAWQVLLQPDPISARRVARDAAVAATKAADRFLDDQQPADALRALDTGRGLMLFAATELRDPGTRLIEAGRPDLAHRWGTEESPPSWLRREVLEVLSRDTGLLDPPDLAEIQAALRALDADALVYLFATSRAGWAVIAPVEGEPDHLPLPNLMIEQGTDIERYLTAMTARDLKLVGVSELGGTARAEFVDSVEGLCGWAWAAAMGPIVEPYLEADRVAHLILIPMGELARVPWQAARGPDGRYLVERVALSQAASARMLCDSAAAAPVRLSSAGLVVADPDTEGRAAELPSARLEAYAIRESFYPNATYLGRMPDGRVSNSGAGTPDEVRAWLRAEGASAGAMLHLASHGVTETALDNASSRLLLAGGDLTAGELINVLAGHRHQLGLAVLAACHTGRSVYGYDEAYSLATMFLAAGVRSVLSTQWSVPDQDTSLLMYMFHHYLLTERCPAWEALRRAQVWMLDDARTPPEGMPTPLRRLLRESDPAQVPAWAGFIHWGQ